MPKAAAAVRLPASPHAAAGGRGGDGRSPGTRRSSRSSARKAAASGAKADDLADDSPLPPEEEESTFTKRARETLGYPPPANVLTAHRRGLTAVHILCRKSQQAMKNLESFMQSAAPTQTDDDDDDDDDADDGDGDYAENSQGNQAVDADSDSDADASTHAATIAVNSTLLPLLRPTRCTTAVDHCALNAACTRSN